MLVRRRNGALLLLPTLLACALGCKGGDDEAKIDDNGPMTVQVRTVAEESVLEHREITGDVAPWEMVPLSFMVGGRISKISFEEGDSIEKGQTIALLNSKDYRLTRDLAEAQVDALDPHLKRARTLMDREAVTQAQLDELESKMEVAKIQKSQAESQLSYARLKAPVSGIVLKKMASVGDMTDASHPVGVVAVLDRVKVVLPVSQRDLPHFEEGGEVVLTAPGTAAGRTFIGKVFSVGYAADLTTRTFPVTLEVANEDLTLRAGMIVEARLDIAEHRGIFVPLDLIGRNLEGAPTVAVADESGVVAERVLTLGKIYGERVEVTAGLAVGDRFIVRGMVKAGDPITVVESATAAAKDAGKAGK